LAHFAERLMMEAVPARAVTLERADLDAAGQPGLPPRVCLAAFGIWFLLLAIGLEIAMRVVAPQLSFREAFDRLVLNGDAGWLRDIDVVGYQWNGNRLLANNIAFLPLYPALVWVFHWVFVSWNVAAFILSMTCEAATVVLLGRLMATVGASRRQSAWAVALALTYPAALFSFTGYGTSLLSLLFVASLLAYKRDHRTLAFCLAGLATAVYYPGFALPVGLVLAELQSRRWHALRPAGVARVLLGFSGYLAFMVYLAARFRSPFASILDQQAWIGSTPLLTTLRRVVTMSPIANGILGLVRWPVEANTMHFLDVPFLVAMIVVAVWLLLDDRGVEVWVFALGALVMLYQAGSADYPFSIIRLSYPFWIILPMHVRFRALMDRVGWLWPLTGCATVMGIWIALVPNGQFLS
jgi:hypothetical protein